MARKNICTFRGLRGTGVFDGVTVGVDSTPSTSLGCSVMCIGMTGTPIPIPIANIWAAMCKKMVV